MGDTAVDVQGVTKIYRLGVKENVEENLASAMVNFLKSPLNNFRKYRSLYRFDDIDLDGGTIPDSVLLALQDVSFSVARGEVMGIVGRNGAGKSTLLKILSRITVPTRGHVTIHGRVSSLLEVGTGFHPELTGRENVYLNGTILGMRKREIDRKFDEIVAFSGVERFLDTPVKRYSSGMRVRLAFAVAANLEPEILIIDEVLAVGDAAFQQKCMDKMKDVSGEGRTVLFVSHNMPAVSALCDRAIMLDGGKKVAEGDAREIVTQYLSTGADTNALREWKDADSAPGGKVARLRAVRVINENNEICETFSVRNRIGLQMEYEVLVDGYTLLPHFCLQNAEGVILFTTLDHDPEWYQKPRPAGRYTSTAWIPENFLNEGHHFVECDLITRNPDVAQFVEPHAVSFFVSGEMGEGTARGDYPGKLDGVVSPILEWHTVRVRG